MSHYLLLTRSITHAQRMAKQLEQAGIPAQYLRPPLHLSTKGCGYAVRIGSRHLRTAAGILAAQGLEPVRIFFAGENGVYQEVSLPGRP